MVELFKRDRPALGTWSQIGSPEVVDMIGLSGFEFAIVDIEHGYFGLETAENLFRACNAVGIAPWIRVPAVDRVIIGKALDCGAQAVVVPGVSSPADAEIAVAATRYAPRGIRGGCPCVRSGGHYIRDWKGYVDRTETQTGAILLVESRAGLDRFEEIVRVPGILAVLVGPFDLSLSLGHEGDYDHPEVQEAVTYMVRHAIEQGVPVVYPVFSPHLEQARDQLNHWYEMGVRTFVVGTDKLLIADQFSRYCTGLRQAVAV